MQLVNRHCIRNPSPPPSGRREQPEVLLPLCSRFRPWHPALLCFPAGVVFGLRERPEGRGCVGATPYGCGLRGTRRGFLAEGWGRAVAVVDSRPFLSVEVGCQFRGDQLGSDPHSVMSSNKHTKNKTYDILLSIADNVFFWIQKTRFFI